MLGGLTPVDDGQAPAGGLPLMMGPNGEMVPLDRWLGDAFGQMYQAARTSMDEAELHRAFYDGDQWDVRVMRALAASGRPPVVYNIVGKAVDNISGRERGMRLKPKLLPRHSGSQLLADGLTRSLEYLREATKAPRALSKVFKDGLLGPLGWLEVAYENEDPTKQPHRVDAVDPRFILTDPGWTTSKGSDIERLCRLRATTLPRALAAYPDQAEALKAALNQNLGVGDPSGTAFGGVPIGGDYGNIDGLYTTSWAPWGGTWGPLRRGWCDPLTGMIILREHWWWEERLGMFAVLPDGTAWEMRDDDPELEAAAQVALDRGAQVREGQVREYHWAVCAGPVVLDWGVSPYWHRQLPYVPFVAFRDRFGQPYGIVRRAVWPQRELNAAHSRMSESARSRWAIIQKGAMTPADKLRFERQLGWSNFVAEVDALGNIQIGSDKADTSMWANIQQDAQAYLHEGLGQNEANYGDTSNETSGKAIEERAAQAAQNQGELFDNLRETHTHLYELLLSNYLQFGTFAQFERVIGVQALERAGGQFDAVQFGRAMGEAVVSTLQFDLTMTDQVESGTAQQAKFRQAVELLGLMPDQVRLAMAPDLVRMSDFPDAEGMALKVEQTLAPLLAPQPVMGAPMGGPAPVLPPGGQEVAPELPQGLEVAA